MVLAARVVTVSEVQPDDNFEASMSCLRSTLKSSIFIRCSIKE